MSSLPQSQLTELQDAHRRVLDRIAAAAARSGRRADQITLVAVTKSGSIEQIAALLAMGQREMGENRVQQLDERYAAIAAMHPAAPPRWHMIGHLQRNKVKQVLPKVCMIHSVDSLRLAQEIDRSAQALGLTADVLLQVNIAEEEQKFGLRAEDAGALAMSLTGLKHLRLRGLMTMAPYSDHAEESRPVFIAAAKLFANIAATIPSGGAFNELSMGMTNDYEVAIEEGATLVRVGRALFGES